MGTFERSIAVAVFACIGCERPHGDSMRERLRDDARLVLEESCGDCHIPGLSTSLDAALAVYDLSAPEWAARMSERQLHDAAQRLAVQADREVLQRFVEAELWRRAGGEP